MSKSELDAVDNAQIDLEQLVTLSGQKFSDFVYGQVPTVQLTKGAVKDIAFEEFDQQNALLEAMEERMDTRQGNVYETERTTYGSNGKGRKR